MFTNLPTSPKRVVTLSDNSKVNPKGSVYFKGSKNNPKGRYPVVDIYWCDGTTSFFIGIQVGDNIYRYDEDMFTLGILSN